MPEWEESPCDLSSEGEASSAEEKYALGIDEEEDPGVMEDIVFGEDLPKETVETMKKMFEESREALVRVLPEVAFGTPVKVTIKDGMPECVVQNQYPLGPRLEEKLREQVLLGVENGSYM